MVGAAFLQLNKVRDACADFLISRYCNLFSYIYFEQIVMKHIYFYFDRFHSHNVLGIRQFADSLSCSQLVTAAEKYIHSNFAKVSQSEEFLSLSKIFVFNLHFEIFVIGKIFSFQLQLLMN